MNFGISYLTENEWTAAGFSGTYGEDIDIRSKHQFYRLCPSDENGKSVCLDIVDYELFLTNKDGKDCSFPWCKVNYQFFNYFPQVPIWLSPLKKFKFFKQLYDYIILSEWSSDGKELLSICLKPRKEYVYMYLDAGDLGVVKIEKNYAEYKFQEQHNIQSFDYPVASVECGVESPYFCTNISVDGKPCESMSWEEIKGIAKKVSCGVLSLVIFQGWRGTELLFQTSNPKYIEDSDVFIQGEDSSGKKYDIVLRLAQSGFDSHLYIHASFFDDKLRKWKIIEKIYAEPSVCLDNNFEKCLNCIKELKNHIFILDSIDCSPSLLISSQSKIFFSSCMSLFSSDSRYLK